MHPNPERAAGWSHTFIAPPVWGICRVMSGRRPLQVHRESNHYVFPLSSCLCVWSKHNVMARRAAANHRAHTGAGIFSSQSALTHRRSGRSVVACVKTHVWAWQTHHAISTASVYSSELAIFFSPIVVSYNKCGRRGAHPHHTQIKFCNQVFFFGLFYITNIFCTIDFVAEAKRNVLFWSTWGFSWC